MQDYKGVYIFDKPVVKDLYVFLFEHIGCGCIFERQDSDFNNTKVKIYAYSEKPVYNVNLRKYFRSRGFHDSVKITQGIDKSEVDAID